MEFCESGVGDAVFVEEDQAVGVGALDCEAFWIDGLVADAVGFEILRI